MKRAERAGLYPRMERHEVEAWIETNCHPDKRDGRYRFRWRENPATRPIVLEVVLDEHHDVPVVVLYAELFASAGFDLATALTNNRFLSVGSIALDGQHLVLRHVLALASLTPSELDRSLRTLAIETSRLRQLPERDARAVHVLFAHFSF